MLAVCSAMIWCYRAKQSSHEGEIWCPGQCLKISGLLGSIWLAGVSIIILDSKFPCLIEKFWKNDLLSVIGKSRLQFQNQL